MPAKILERRSFIICKDHRISHGTSLLHLVRHWYLLICVVERLCSRVRLARDWKDRIHAAASGPPVCKALSQADMEYTSMPVRYIT